MKNGLWARPDTSDVGTWHDVFDDDKAWHLPTRLYRSNPRAIFDVGAYVGYTTCDFLYHYPDAHVVAFEPDSENYKIAEINLSSNLSSWVSLLPYAVSSQNTSGRLEGTGFNNKKFVPDSTSSSIMSKSLDFLYGFAWVDILKLDVEGAEKEILKRGGERWPRQTGTIVVEVHNDYYPDEAQYDLEQLGFSVYRESSLDASLTAVNNW